MVHIATRHDATVKRSKPALEQPETKPNVPVRAIVGGVAGVLILAALTWGWIQWRHAESLARLPPPPQLSPRQAVIAGHLRAAYETARANPRSIDAVGALCRAYHADMFFDLADRCYEQAIALASDDWRWVYYRALIRSERGGGDALVADLREVVRRAPEFGPAWLRLGEAEFKAGRYAEAGEVWRRVRDLPEPEASSSSPRHVTEVPLAAYASLGLARIAMANGESDRARQLLEEVAQATPQFGSALRLLAEAYRRLGREDDAARLVYRAGRLSPYAPYADPIGDELARESRNSTLLLRLSSEANLAVNAEWSEFLTRRALEFDPANPDVVLKLARVLRTVGRNDEALRYFQRYHELVPEDYQGLAHIGSCLSALGRYEEAESYFTKALVGVDDPVTHYNLGLLLAITGRLDAAATEYQKALDRDPKHSDARMNLASLYARQGRLDRAARELERLVIDDPENAIARTNLGLVFLQQGQVEPARVQLTEALRLNPQLTPAADALATLNR